ncbi:regulatory protein GntR HTH [Clostridium sp. DL-VIII]|uniref:GntR family transcriptional regulator n=1 Tax=Clostridium sp. DL-VIII TaxID=641107 RepID=UPI00023B0454|nr:GntR family transcriptional regulator [Clostridium sp. DL-VIII]EHJ00744.1 regulatory protein GntR HTH [Clostridium sp. DL-VIII]
MEDSIETIIIDNLMLDINSGKYKANEKLPSENELVDNYGVPTIIEREILDCSNLVPLLILECNSIDDNTGKILQHTKIFYRTDCFKYIVSYA